MNVFRIPTSRIIFAIVISLLIHASIIYLLDIQPTPEKLLLPPLTVKLQPLPKSTARPAEIPERVSRASKPDESSSEKPIVQPLETMKEMEKSANIYLFPKHLTLSFDVYEGGGILRIAVIRHQLEVNSEIYTLNAVKQSAGFLGLYDGDGFTQVSQGKIDKQGLHPDTFIEEKVTGGRKLRTKTVFDWVGHTLHFSTGGETVLTTGAQDILSFMYQFSQLPMLNEIVSLSISNGVHLDEYKFEIGHAEDVISPIGNLRARHLRKMHAPSEPYFEIWLAEEYRLLPVKFRQIDSAGHVSEELIITDIRASDD